MPSRISPSELHRLRNQIDIAALIDHFDLPWKVRDGFFRFLCPLCSDFHTATNPRTNLARCFRCQRNFNPIDLTILMRRTTFLEAVRYLQTNAPRIRPPQITPQ